MRVPIVVCFASVDWGFNWQIPQEVATGLAAGGHRVLYVENTGVRRIRAADAGRVVHRLANWWRARGRTRAISPGIDVLSPVLLPLPYSPVACRLNAATLVRQVHDWIGSATAPTPPIIYLTFLPTPLSAAVGEALSPAVEAYYCSDNFVESSPGARPIAPHEAALMGRADLVLTTSAGLQRVADARSGRAVLLPCGVRCQPFEAAADAAWRDPSRLPPLLQALPRPIAGFIGSVRDALDLPLVVAAARLAPDIAFVLVGPIMADVRALRACPNVVLVDPMPHDAIVQWTAGFDVGLLPYARTPFTDDLMPMKLKEYLAAGLPVVATGLPEVRRFEARHGSLVTFAETPEALVAAVRRGAAERSPAAVAARRAAARHYDWSRQIAQLQRLLWQVLDARLARTS